MAASRGLYALLIIIILLYGFNYFKFYFLYIFLVSIDLCPQISMEFSRLCGIDTLIKFFFSFFFFILQTHFNS